MSAGQRRTKLQIRITAPETIGKQVTYTMARRKLPTGVVRCIPVGSTKAAKTC